MSAVILIACPACNGRSLWCRVCNRAGAIEVMSDERPAIKAALAGQAAADADFVRDVLAIYHEVVDPLELLLTWAKWAAQRKRKQRKETGK